MDGHDAVPSPRASIIRTAALAFLFFAVARASAHADDLAALFDPGTMVSVGGLAGAGPRFQAARRYGAWGLPYFSFRKADEAPEWWAPDDAFDLSLFGDRAAQAGAVLDVRDARSTRDDRRLFGLPTLPLSAGLGAFVEVWPVEDRLRLRAEVTQGLRAHDGVVAKLAADLVLRSGRLTVGVGPRLVLGDAAAQRLDFDVPVRTALLNGALTPYRAAAGARSGGGTLSLSYDWSEAWQSVAYIRGERYLASAAASPITRRVGSESNVSVGLGAIRTFRLTD